MFSSGYGTRTQTGGSRVITSPLTSSETSSDIWGRLSDLQKNSCDVDVASGMLDILSLLHFLSSTWPNMFIFFPSLRVSSRVFRMVAGCAGVSEDSSSRQQQSWRWRALQNQPSWTWTRAWLWPASPSFACCWWPWSSAVQRSSWTHTAQSPPPRGRNSTWMTDTLKHTYTCIYMCVPPGNHTWNISTRKESSVVRQGFCLRWLPDAFHFQN